MFAQLIRDMDIGHVPEIRFLSSLDDSWFTETRLRAVLSLGMELPRQELLKVVCRFKERCTLIRETVLTSVFGLQGEEQVHRIPNWLHTCLVEHDVLSYDEFVIEIYVLLGRYSSRFPEIWDDCMVEVPTIDWALGGQTAASTLIGVPRVELDDENRSVELMEELIALVFYLPRNEISSERDVASILLGDCMGYDDERFVSWVGECRAYRLSRYCEKALPVRPSRFSRLRSAMGMSTVSGRIRESIMKATTDHLSLKEWVLFLRREFR